MDRTVPVKGFTPLDLLKHAEMIERVVAPLDVEAGPVLKADAMGRPYAEVIVRLVGRPPLRVTVEEVP